MSVKQYIKGELRGIYKSHYMHAVKKHYDKFYGDLCKLNHVSAENPVGGEAEWVKTWSGLKIKPNPVYYRLFSKYVGCSSNIVPEDICRVTIEYLLNPPRFRKTYGDKNLWDSILPKGTLPPTIFRCMDGFIYDGDYNAITDANDKRVAEILDRSGYDKFIIKPSRESNSSQGVHVIVRDGKHFTLGDTELLSLSSLQKYDGENYIVQPFMEQHKGISKFCDTSVNPLRICTYRSVIDNEVHVLDGPVLRIGYKGETNDGTHGNGKFVGIEPDGMLKHKALDYLGQESEVFNGIDFREDHIVPGFEKACELAKKVARQTLHHRLMAFDIMVDRTGEPVMLEYNLEAFSIWLAQFVGEEAFGEYTQEIIDYTKKNLDAIEFAIY